MRSFVFGVAVSALLALGGCTKIEARDLIREGNAFYRDGRYRDAIEAYSKAIELEPSGVTVFWNRACAAESIVLKSKDREDAKARKDFADMALADFKTWHDRLEAPTPEDAEQAHNHRLAILDADERCDDLLTYWLDKHNKNPSEEALYSTIARQYDKCNRTKEADEWFEKRTQDFPESVRAYHSLAIRRFEPLFPDPESPLPFNSNMSESERIEIANSVIALLDKATLIDAKFRDAYIWKSMAYTQRALARRFGDDVENQTPEENLNRIFAREDSLLAWKQQKAVCDIDSLPECTSEALAAGAAGSCCPLPPPPLSAEEQAADAELKRQIEQQIADLAAGIAPPDPKKKKGKGKR
ncbi:MAG: tetratricopeptide repeat protein [Nannocystis sp.]|nr:tetratricopeptide repeat protein [Nannocystis sp.]